MSDPLPVLELDSCLATLNGIPTAEGAGLPPEAESICVVAVDVGPAEATSDSSLTEGLPQPTFAKTSGRREQRGQTTKFGWLVPALRSRSLRIAASIVGVLIVAGLIGMNWRSSRSPNNDELAEVDLTEFNDDAGFGAPRINGELPRQPRKVLVDDATSSSGDRVSPAEFGLRLPPASAVNPAIHVSQSSGIQTAAGFSPISANGSQGARLTGQIEFESRK